MSSLGILLVAVLAAAPAAQAGSSSPGPTFAKDIAPIVWKNCTSCHRPGEVGPFPLLTYEDVSKRADFVAEISASRRMPPWKAEPNYGKFHDERRLTDAEIATLQAWAKNGAPEGDAKDLPAPPKFVEGWQLGEPDLILEMPEAFTVPADGRDVYRCFVIPIPTIGARTVAAAEFRPGNRRVVHHAILYLDANGEARKKDAADAGPGYASFGGPGVLPTGGLGGWAPGAMPRKLPEGTGKFLRAGSDLVLQMHYHPSGKAETDRSSVGIYFTKKPATTLVGGLAVMNHRIYIPAGENKYETTAQSEKLPVDVNVLGLGPHMHLLGRSMKVFAETPEGKTIPLVWIKDWDFNWQGSYAFVEPVRLPKGSVIKLEATYDNSPDNPHNPSSPPKPVSWGEQTTDEMCLLSVQVTTDSTADLREVVLMRSARLGGALAGGVQSRDLDAGDLAASGAKGATGGKSAKGNDELVDALIDGILDRGFDIQPKHKELLKPFDKNEDQRVSRAEFDAMPAGVKFVIRQAIRSRVDAAVNPKKP